MGHVNDHVSVAVTEVAMPCLQVGYTFSIESARCVRGWNGLRMSDEGTGAVQGVEALSGQKGPVHNHFVVFVRNPTLIWTEGDEVVAVPSEGRDRDKTSCTRRYK